MMILSLNGFKNLQIRWLPFAAKDIEHIEKHLKDKTELGLKNVISEIFLSINRLKSSPGIGRPGRVTGTKELILKNYPYTIPYRVNGDFIEILRIFHQRKKWPKHL
jgi:toxin ParE1/3/4